MSVRAIKRIHEEGGLYIKIPDSISDVRNYYGTFFCKVLNHFNKDKNLVRKINESARFESNWMNNHVLLSCHPLTEKYGFVKEDYIELLFESIEKQKRKWFRREIEEIPIFPQRIIEDLDFVPK